MSTAIFSIPDNEGRQHVYTGQETTMRLFAVREHSVSSRSTWSFSYHNSNVKPDITYVSGGMTSFPNPSSSSQFRISEGRLQNVSVTAGKVSYQVRNDARFTITFRVYIYGRN